MKTEMRAAGLSCIRFTTNGTSDPDPALIVDPGGILDVDEPVVWAAQSIFAVKLQNRFVRVFTMVHLLKEDVRRVQILDGYVEGTNADNGFGVRVQNADGTTSADTTGYEIEVWICTTSWLGRGET
jgi:hypothetical protein